MRAAWAVRRDKVMGEVMPLVDHYLDSCPPDYRFTRIKNDCKALLRTLEDPARGISALPRRELLDKLVRYLREHGTQQLLGQCLPENKGMAALAREMGFEVRPQPAQDVVTLRYGL